MFKRIGFLSFLLATLSMTLMVSCSTDDTEELTEDFRSGFGEELENREGFARENDCFSLVFPISFTMPDGVVLEITEDESIKEVLQTYKDENPDLEGKPELNYPIEVILAENDSTLIINNQEEMRALKKDCGFKKGKGGKGHHGKGGKNKCFEIQLPVSFTMPDGSTLTLEEGDNKRELFKEWKENNPDVEGKPELNFPVTVILKEDGSEVEVNSYDELKALREDCE